MKLVIRFLYRVLFFLTIQLNKLFSSFGKIIVGLNFLASSNFIDAYVIKIKTSPILTFLAAAPFTVISPDFLDPGMT